MVLHKWLNMRHRGKGSGGEGEVGGGGGNHDRHRPPSDCFVDQTVYKTVVTLNLVKRKDDGNQPLIHRTDDSRILQSLYGSH